LTATIRKTYLKYDFYKLSKTHLFAFLHSQRINNLWQPYPLCRNDQPSPVRLFKDGRAAVKGYFVDAIDTISRYSEMIIDPIVNFNGTTKQEVTTADKTLMEQVKMIRELEPEEKSMVFKMVDTFLTKKKFKEFFQKNVAAL